MKKKHFNQSGVSDAALLFVFVVVIIAVIVALPKFLKWREEAKIPAEVRHLRRIYAAEQKYRTRISINQTYAAFRELEMTGALPGACETCEENTRTFDGFRFELSRNYEETRFCVEVSGGGGKRWALDADGSIFESAGNRVGCAAGEVTGSDLQKFAAR